MERHPVYGLEDNIAKTVTLPKVTCRFSAVALRITTMFL